MLQSDHNRLINGQQPATASQKQEPAPNMWVTATNITLAPYVIGAAIMARAFWWLWL